MTSIFFPLKQILQAKSKRGRTLGMALVLFGLGGIALVLSTHEHIVVKEYSAAMANPASIPAASTATTSAITATPIIPEQPTRAPSPMDSHIFVERLETLLPSYAAFFIDSAADYGHDWRLLAAIGYQESKWDPQAVSPTGVKGLMMLTQITAQQVNIEDREDPAESILGAARYLQWLDKHLPKTIHADDRIWFTLAAYNVGMGHVLDARVLTQRNNQDPNSWVDVRNHLPLLSKEDWYSTVRHGYARGYEPVDFVDKVRHYKQLLSKHVDEELLVKLIADLTSSSLPG